VLHNQKLSDDQLWASCHAKLQKVFYCSEPLWVLYSVNKLQFLLLLPKKTDGTCIAFNKHLAISTTDWFLLSTTPFCCGVYGVVV
jgi:hypothetical protein